MSDTRLARHAVSLALLLVVSAQGAWGQVASTLHIRVSLLDAGVATPVARHRLLISDNPATAPPLEVVTGADGTVDVLLKPANYTVESDQPVVLHGKAYRWIQIIDVVAGRDATLDLTHGNALVDTETAATTPAALSGTMLLEQWKNSLVSLWTPTSRASGFVVDTRGLVATSQRAIGAATTAEVQLSPDVKVTGSVVRAEPGRDVAILRVDPAAVASVAPVPLECGSATPPSPKPADRVLALGVPMRGPKAAEPADLGRVGPHWLETDLYLAAGSLGGPVFGTDGRFVGLTSIVDGSDERRPDFRVIRSGDVCAVVASAEKAMASAPAPSAVRLPVEPALTFTPEALERAATQLGGTIVQASSPGFDVALITPARIYAARNPVRPKSLPVRPRGTSAADPYEEARRQAVMDFGSWAPYFVEDPPVLLLRVTPRMVESFWKMVARGAAMSQGIAIPALKRYKSSFERMRVFCGSTEVTPIHPFLLTRAISDTSAITEGLYVFEPDALSPRCGTVKLVMYSEESGEKGDSLTLDARVLQQVADEFAALRGQP